MKNISDEDMEAFHASRAKPHEYYKDEKGDSHPFHKHGWTSEEYNKWEAGHKKSHDPMYPHSQKNKGGKS